MPRRLTLTRPDDWHLHLRDGAMLAGVLPASRDFARGLVMPNLAPPVATAREAAAYRDRIFAALPAGQGFTPLMTLYLTEATDPDDVAAAAAEGLVTAVKLYPAGATTNSARGVRDIARVMPALERMAAIGLPLCVHGEVADPEVDIFDREAVFVERVLDPLRVRLPELRIVMEHVTTRDGVDFIAASTANLAGTLTAHHLVLNRNHLLAGAVRPHYYCLPVPKRETHRQALRAAAVSGDPRFFLGTDSAPHARHTKEHACGCAGVYTAHAGIELYAEAFDAAGALPRLEAFASLHGADFYGLPRNSERLTLRRSACAVPEEFAFGEDRLVPLRAGGSVAWCLE